MALYDINTDPDGLNILNNIDDIRKVYLTYYPKSDSFADKGLYIKNSYNESFKYVRTVFNILVSKFENFKYFEVKVYEDTYCSLSGMNDASYCINVIMHYEEVDRVIECKIESASFIRDIDTTISFYNKNTKDFCVRALYDKDLDKYNHIDTINSYILDIKFNYGLLNLLKKLFGYYCYFENDEYALPLTRPLSFMYGYNDPINALKLQDIGNKRQREEYTDRYDYNE